MPNASTSFLDLAPQSNVRLSTLGCGSVVSNVLTITVNPQLIAGSVAASQTICYGATPAALTSTGLPTGGVGTYTYQWKSSLNNSNEHFL